MTTHRKRAADADAKRNRPREGFGAVTTPSAEALALLTPAQRGLVFALDLHWRADPKTWRARVDEIQEPEARKVADDYLRAIVGRIRAYLQLKKGE